jgi:endonuclease/exonuclease/phosphatase family metal-dependent hydrolase
LKLISWNTAGRTGKCPDQVKALLDQNPDVIALQEVLSEGRRRFREELERCHAELKHVLDSFELAQDLDLLRGRRRYGELIASRWALIRMPPADFPVPWTERVLSAIISTPWGEVELHTAHIPPGSAKQEKWKKVEMLEGIYERLTRQHSRPTILCGDFNTPQAELPDGTVITWAWRITKSGKRVLERATGQRWDDAEQNVLTGLMRFDLADAFRRIHGYSVEDFSWKTRNGIGRRFDHVFASAQLNPVQCRYLHDLRERGLSDHSPIQVTFNPKMGG